MTKNLVAALSILYIINGLWNIGNFIYPLSISSELIEYNLAPLINGALALYIGFQLVQFREFGRKFAIFLSYVRVAISAYYFFWLLHYIQNTKEYVESSISFGDKLNYTFADPFIAPGFVLVETIIVLLIIVFLSQAKTKQLFSPKISSGKAAEAIGDSA